MKYGKDGEFYKITRSPSLRRVWVEMSTILNDTPERKVTLLVEGVG